MTFFCPLSSGVFIFPISYISFPPLSRTRVRYDVLDELRLLEIHELALDGHVTEAAAEGARRVDVRRFVVT